MAYFDNGNEIFKEARKHHYAVGTHNTNNLEWTRAELRAAEETRTPLPTQVSTGTAKHIGGYKPVEDMVADQMDAMNVSVPVILNLDHGDSESAKECIKLGYSSVMLDGHALPIEESLAKTKEIVKLAHGRGISVEAEIGKIGENQGGGELTLIEDAKALVAAGVDKPAYGIGNTRGVYPADWKSLNFDRLKEIVETVPDTPLVLHGGLGIPQDQIEKAIQLGVAKINTSAEFQLAFQETTHDYIMSEKDLSEDYEDYDSCKPLLPGTEAIITKMREMISWMGTKTTDDEFKDASFDRSSLNEE